MAGSALREIFARFGVAFDAGPLVQGEAAVTGVVSKLRELGNIVAGGAVVVGLRNFVSEMTELGDEIGDTATMLGVSTTELQEWQHVAGLSGAEANEFTGSMTRLSRQIAEAAGGNATAGAIFRRLGVDIRNTDGSLRNTSDVLTDLADPIAALGSHSERVGVLMDLLGRSGARMAPLFERGSEGIMEARAELAQLGGGAIPEFVEAAGAADDANRRLDVAWLSIKSRLAVFLLPALASLAEMTAKVGGAFTRVADKGRLLETILVALGVAAAAAGARTAASWVAAAAPFVALAAVVAGAILIFEDLWVGVEGGRSQIMLMALAWEEWAENLVVFTDGPLKALITALEFVRGVLASIVQGLGLVAGSNLLGDAGAMVGREGGVDSARAGEIVAERRSRMGMLGEFLMPDTFERSQALAQARQEREASAGITNQVAIQVNASGLSAAQAETMVQRAVAGALRTETEDAVEALAQ